MVSKTQAKYIRISPRKARDVIEVVKGKSVLQALAILRALNKKGARILEKVVRSAIANAKSKGYQDNALFISKAIANEGPSFKRYRSATFGRATMIKKRTSHIVVELDASEKILEGIKAK